MAALAGAWLGMAISKRTPTASTDACMGYADMTHHTLRRIALLGTAAMMAVALSGCASWFGPQPGLLSVDISSQCAVKVEDGRQYARISGNFRRSVDGICEGKFEAVGVEVFQGQAIGAQRDAVQMQMLQQMLSVILARFPGSQLPLPVPPVP